MNDAAPASIEANYRRSCAILVVDVHVADVKAADIHEFKGRLPCAAVDAVVLRVQLDCSASCLHLRHVPEDERGFEHVQMPVVPGEQRGRVVVTCVGVDPNHTEVAADSLAAGEESSFNAGLAVRREIPGCVVALAADLVEELVGAGVPVAAADEEERSTDITVCCGATLRGEDAMLIKADDVLENTLTDVAQVPGFVESVPRCGQGSI